MNSKITYISFYQFINFMFYNGIEFISLDINRYYFWLVFWSRMLFHLPSVAIGRWFGQNKGKATSISVLGFSLGEAIFPIIMTFIISFVGWKFS